MIQDVKGIKGYTGKINPYVSLAAGHKPHGAVQWKGEAFSAPFTPGDAQ